MQRGARADNRLLLLTERPGKTKGRIEILIPILRAAEFVSQQRFQVLGQINVVIEDVCLERPTQSVIERESWTKLPTVLNVKADEVVGQDLVVPVGRRLARTADSDGQRGSCRPSHRKLQQFRKRGAGACISGLQTGGERVVECAIKGLELCRAEGRERSRRVSVPGPMIVAVFPVAAETDAVASRRPVDVVGPLIGARMAI